MLDLTSKFSNNTSISQLIIIFLQLKPRKSCIYTLIILKSCMYIYTLIILKSVQCHAYIILYMHDHDYIIIILYFLIIYVPHAHLLHIIYTIDVISVR